MHHIKRPLRLGTRASALAVAQANLVRQALCDAHGWEQSRVELVTMTATGDRILDRSLADIGGKALWTKELDRALLDGDVDIAVHSMKDVETIRPSEIALVAMLPRADPRDRLVGASSIDDLKARARVGTNSPRRAAQLKALRPDLQIVMFRGNVATRLRRLENDEADATLLAAAGLDRLGLHDVGITVPIDAMLPAASQGAIGVEARTGDTDVASLLASIAHAETMACVAMERAVLESLQAGCHSPVAAFAAEEGGALCLRAEILLPDGSERVSGEQNGSNIDPEELASDLLDRASPTLRAVFGA